MKRRNFLAGLLGSAAGAAVAATLDVEKLLWEPTKTLFLPPEGGWVSMAPGFKTIRFSKDAFANIFNPPSKVLEAYHRNGVLLPHGFDWYGEISGKGYGVIGGTLYELDDTVRNWRHSLVALQCHKEGWKGWKDRG